ncbi:hypothetical protein GEMRC1_001284 [Eukaryota sp. GEM-RC1]
MGKKAGTVGDLDLCGSSSGTSVILPPYCPESNPIDSIRFTNFFLKNLSAEFRIRRPITIFDGIKLAEILEHQMKSHWNTEGGNMVPGTDLIAVVDEETAKAISKGLKNTKHWLNLKEVIVPLHNIHMHMCQAHL